MCQRILTIEEAEAIYYDEINAYQLLCDIQSWLGFVCQQDFDYGWDHFMVRHGDREELVNEAQRKGFEQALSVYDDELLSEREMTAEMWQR